MLGLKQLRNKIDAIDTAIIKKLSQRQSLIIKIGKLKKKTGKKIKDEAREKKLIQLYDQLSEQYQLDKQFTRRLFKTIIVYSRRLQK